MAPHRNPMARRPQIGFGCYGILTITEPITYVSQQLHQRHAEIGGIALTPVRKEHGHTVKDELAEARVILGEIIYLRHVGDRHMTGGSGKAVEGIFAFHLEPEVDRREFRVEPRQRHAGAVFHKPQRVGGIIATGSNMDFQVFESCFRGILVEERDLVRSDATDPLAAGDLNIRRCQLLKMGEKGARRLPAEVEAQPSLPFVERCRLPVHYFQVIDAVQRRMRPCKGASIIIAAKVDHPVVLRWNCADCRSWVLTTMYCTATRMLDSSLST